MFFDRIYFRVYADLNLMSEIIVQELNFEITPKFKNLVFKILSNATIRVRTYKLNELEKEITRLHTKEFAYENFFVPTRISGIEHQIPDEDLKSQISNDLAQLAKVLNVQTSAAQISKRLDGFGNSHTITPLIDNFVYAYTNLKAIKNGGLLVIKLETHLGRMVYSAYSKVIAENKSKEALRLKKEAAVAYMESKPDSTEAQ